MKRKRKFLRPIAVEILFSAFERFAEYAEKRLERKAGEM